MVGGARGVRRTAPLLLRHPLHLDDEPDLLADMIDEHKATGARTVKAEQALAKIEALADALTAKSDTVLSMRQRRASR